ncbi:hypothetical protein J7T55_010036 [Diaporthe amygdali]|uniref:uncharacterized protein n=1 Tax=Phomopsis amygdali TaxID=1214568 RepID=UPI0022FEBE16|nr:uncharacterized protein J7T55_010036 [Diaporthe amygdali]KAJ0116885.1 hypothetical protein J7T55_010036 [Diaporthe amygdali]
MSSSQATIVDLGVDDDPGVIVRQSQSDLRLLETGEFSNFTVVCGDREWKAHKAIISKVPYFKAMVGGGFKETIQEKTTIKEFFEPFEIQWLMSYIYFPHFDLESARLDTASQSHLETCVRLWHIGDYFQVDRMSKLAEDKLKAGCDHWRQCSGTVDTTKHGTSFIVDLESAIRQAWRQDLVSGPLQAMLISLCLDFAPYVRRHESFGALLEEIPQFAVVFSQRALGSIISSLRLPKPSQIMDPGPIHDDILFAIDIRRSFINLTANEERRRLPSGTQRLGRTTSRGAFRPPK